MNHQAVCSCTDKEESGQPKKSTKFQAVILSDHCLLSKHYTPIVPLLYSSMSSFPALSVLLLLSSPVELLDLFPSNYFFAPFGLCSGNVVYNSYLFSQVTVQQLRAVPFTCSTVFSLIIMMINLTPSLINSQNALLFTVYEPGLASTGDLSRNIEFGSKPQTH